MKIDHRPSPRLGPSEPSKNNQLVDSATTSPLHADAFERVVESLLLAPMALLKGGNENGLADFLKQGPFDHQQLLQDLLTLSKATGPLAAMRTGLGGTSSSGSARDIAAPASGQNLPDIKLAGGEVGNRSQNRKTESRQASTILGRLHGQKSVGRTVDSSARGNVSLGQRGLRATGSARHGRTGTAEVRGGISNALFDARGGIGATGDVGAHANGDLTLNAADGLRAKGQAGVNLSGHVHMDGSLRSALLNADVQGQAGGRLGANVHGSVVANAQEGFRLKAGADAEAMVRAEMKGQFQTLGVDVGGERLDVNGNVHAYAEAGARAQADLDVTASVQPPRLGLDASAGAFAGAKAGVEAKIGLGEFVSVTGKAEAWAGAGAEAGIIAGFDEGKLRFGFHAGAAVKAGAGTEWSVEIDVAKMLKAFAGGSLQVAGRSLEFALNPQQAIQHSVQDVLGLVLGKDAANSLPLGSQFPGLSPLGLLGPGLSQKALEESPVNEILDQILKKQFAHLPL